MVGLIILYDHLAPQGAFCKQSPINVLFSFSFLFLFLFFYFFYSILKKKQKTKKTKHEMKQMK